MTKRFIEEVFPIKEVSVLSAREKSIRRGHIATLHNWWARKPLSSSRTTAYAALIPTCNDERALKEKREFIINIAKWENSLNSGFLEKARTDILAASKGIPPKVLDPFAGGGSIPLETLRLGCETYASDFNPVAVLLEKAVLEYPQKYAGIRTGSFGLEGSNVLLEDVKKWGGWLLEKARFELKEFYPDEEDGSVPLSYIWARTVHCQNPSCQTELPLVHQFSLVDKEHQQVALCPYVDNGEIRFKIVGTGYDAFPPGFKAKDGTVSKAIATCRVCGSVIDAKTMRMLFQEKKSGQKIVAVVLRKPGLKGKFYRIATQKDLDVFRKATDRLADKVEILKERWGMNPVPDEPIPTPENKEYQPGSPYYNFTPIVLYGMIKWGDLYNNRQKLALISLIEYVREAYELMIEDGYGPEYAKAIVTYLAIQIDKVASSSNTTARWQPKGEKIADSFSRQALPMIWGYPETNVLFGASRSFSEMFKDVIEVISSVAVSELPATVFQASATSIPYSDNYFDAVFTDPPYYDNVPYSYISDFFYVWLRRSLGHLYPELFTTPVSSKKNEIIAEVPLLRGTDKGKVTENLPSVKTSQTFEKMLGQAFQEIHRVLKTDGIAIIVYAHKSTAGWETLINSLLDSGLIITAAWPLNTEMRSRLRSQGSAALASSTYIIARKMDRLPTAFYNDVKEELKKQLNLKLSNLWIEQSGDFDPNIKTILEKDVYAADLFSGADFFIAAIGFAIEVFGKYEKVIDYEGNVIRADKLLDDVQTILTDYTVKQILHNGFGGAISDLTRFYILWRFHYGDAKVRFDEARKLAQFCGIDLTQEWDKGGFIQKEKEFVRVLGPQARDAESLKGSLELIDIIHLACLLWSKSKREEMLTILSHSGFGSDEAFYRVAQGISETLPTESKEKQLLEGFLAGKERLKEDIKKQSGPTSLSDWT